MASSVAKQAKGMKWLFWTGFFCSILAFLSLFVAFATPYWIQSWRRVHSPLANTGLWEICLSGYIKPRDPNLAAYVGCWWIHTTIFHDIANHIMPRKKFCVIYVKKNNSTLTGYEQDLKVQTPVEYD